MAHREDPGHAVKAIQKRHRHASQNAPPLPTPMSQSKGRVLTFASKNVNTRHAFWLIGYA